MSQRVPFTRLLPAALIAVGAVAYTQSAAQPLKLKGTPIVSVTSPNGSGTNNIEVIRDGIYPTPESGTWSQSYDTFDGQHEPQEAYFGYTFAEPYVFTKLIFHQGFVEANEPGATFIDPKVQVLVGEVWTDVENLQSTPPYTISTPAFTSVAFTFTPLQGTGIRIIGMEQATEPWVSCSELDVEDDSPTGSSPTLRSMGKLPSMTATIKGGRIHLSMSQSALPSPAKLSIINLAGSVVYTYQWGSTAIHQVDAQLLSSGIYVARLTSGKRLLSRCTFAR